MSDFLKMAAIAKRNGKIGSAPLGNITNMQTTKKGVLVTIGISQEWGDRLMNGECVGAFYLVDKTEWARECAHAADPNEVYP